MRTGPSYTQEELAAAVSHSFSITETLRNLGMCFGGGSHAVLKKYIQLWRIDTDHFDSYKSQRSIDGNIRVRHAQPLDEILVEHSTYSRGHLKTRLYESGLKLPICELCWQDEMWQGRRMSLILDHINGVRDDHRLGNLRIVCPNCNATLDTHCGKNVTT